MSLYKLNNLTNSTNSTNLTNSTNSTNSNKKNIVFNDQEYNNLVKQIETYVKTDSGKKVLKEIKIIQTQLQESIKSLEKDLKELEK